MSAGAAERHAGLRTTRLLLVAGVISALGVAAQMAALPMAFASYVIAVKRISILLSVVAGRIFFGEHGLRNRLFAALLMLAGLVVLALT